MSINDNQYIEVRNLTSHKVGYKIEEDNIRRVFNAYEIKKIKAGELRKASYQYGNSVLFKEFLCINNKELAEEFGVPSDAVEYWWTKEDIDRVLQEGSMDEFLDALDYGPKGIISMIVDRALSLKLNSAEKREAIKEKLGYDITKMIEIQEATNNSAKASVEEKKPRRRVAQAAEGRRVSTE